MLRERRPKPKSLSPNLTSPKSADFQFIYMPKPSKMEKSQLQNEQHMPIDRIISTSVESISCNDKIKIENNKINQNGLRHYLNINIMNSSTQEKLFQSNTSNTNSGLNTFLSHNAKYQNLHLILILLLMFCIFLIISLCSPDMIGIDDSFQELYKPQTHNDNFIFVYGPLINKQYELRKYIKFTPKKNPYILHDHFDPNMDAKKMKKTTNNDDDSYENDETALQAEFPVRIHHLKRGFYFDTSFNDMDNEQIIKYKQGIKKKNENDGDIITDNKHRVNHSYTALGVQFDEEYDMTVNGLLLRIDEQLLLEFDVHGFGKAFKRETIPLQWIDFLYSKPREFMKNMELEEETLNTIKKETIEDANMNSKHVNESSLEIGVINVKKEDIEDANSMVQKHVDIEIEKKIKPKKAASESESDNNNIDSDLDIELMDLIDNEQGVILEDNKKINKESNEKSHNENIANKKQNELEVINEENTKKYQLNVWTYIVPKEIMIDDTKGQFERIMKQSYIDIILSGCLDIGGTQFTKEFVQSTYGWTPFMVWNDDRGHSKQFKLEESFITKNEHTKIDSLLQKFVFGHA